MAVRRARRRWRSASCALRGRSASSVRSCARRGGAARRYLRGVSLLQQFLGVDPLYFWADQDPARRAECGGARGPGHGEKPASGIGAGSSTTRMCSRGGNRAPHHTGIALATLNKLFEALLRLKGNMIVPGTFISRMSRRSPPPARAASSSHSTTSKSWKPTHTANRRSAVFIHGPAGPDYFGLGQSRGGLSRRPGSHLDARLPGARPTFWRDDESAGESGGERAAVIQRAIEKQIEIVAAHRDHSYFLMNAWRRPCRSFARACSAASRHHAARPTMATAAFRTASPSPKETASTPRRDVQFPCEPAHRNGRSTASEGLGRAAKAGATECLLMNASDVRPVPMTTRAVMDWPGTPRARSSGGAMDYLRRWSAEEFGPRAADTMDPFFQAYFQAPGRYGQGRRRPLATTLLQLRPGFPVAGIDRRSLELCSWMERLTKGAREAGPRGSARESWPKRPRR